MAEVEGASVVDRIIITVPGEVIPAEVEELAPDDHQPSTVVEDALVDQLSRPQKAVFKAGLSMTVISIIGILNPPTSAATLVNTTHATILSGTFHFLVFVSLATGIVLMLISIILHRKPRLIIIAKPLTEVGWASVKITLGYGSALVLIVSAPPWFALCLLFVYILTK